MMRASGWLADPTGQHEHRYWNGSDWTDNVADGGQQSISSLSDPPPPPPTEAPEEPVRGSPSWRRRVRGAYLGGLIDRPLEKDWIVWLAGLAMAAGAYGAYQNYTTRNPLTGETAFHFENAFVLDLAFALAFQALLFGVVPALIRRWVRSRRDQPTQPPAEVSSPSPAEIKSASPAEVDSPSPAVSQPSPVDYGSTPRPKRRVSVVMVGVGALLLVAALLVGVVLVKRNDDVTLKATIAVTTFDDDGNGTTCHTDQNAYVSEAKKSTIIAVGALDKRGTLSSNADKCRVAIRIEGIPNHPVFDIWTDEDDNGRARPTVYWRLRSDQMSDGFILRRS